MAHQLELSSPTARDSPTRDPITNDILYLVEIYLLGVATSLISLFGVITNMINFIVFSRQNWNDCVSLCLMSLTFSDLGAMFTNLIYSSSYLVKVYNPNLTVDPIAVQYIMSWTCAFFFDISMATTAFVSLERCLCVVMPFHFRNVFTFRIAVFTILGIYIFNIGSYMPVFLTMRFQKQIDPIYNYTRVMLLLLPTRPEIEKFSNIFTHIAVATICQIIVLISTQAMIVGLQRASEFRLTKASVPSLESNYEIHKITNGCQNNALRNTGSRLKKSIEKDSFICKVKVNRNKSVQSSKISGVTCKNKAVSKMVSILCAIFITCNFWRLAVVYSRRVEPAISPEASLSNTYILIVGIWQFIGAINCSVNIFVYYTQRASYRDLFLKIFCPSTRSK